MKFNLSFKKFSNSKIDASKRGKMGKLANKFKIKGETISTNPKTNESFKKTKYNDENIIKKIIRKIIRSLPELLNNNIKDIFKYRELKNMIKMKIGRNSNSNIKSEKEVFKSLENNSKKNSITCVTVNNYLKIKDMTLNGIFKKLNVSRINKNYFPFHNRMLIKIIKGRNEEDKIIRILDFKFHDILLLYKYLPKYLNDNMKNNDLNLNLKGMQYYKTIVERNYNSEIKEKINTLIDGINIESFRTICDTIKKFSTCKNEDEYDEKYVNKYIDLVFQYDEFFERREKNKIKINVEKSEIVNSNSKNESSEINEEEINNLNYPYKDEDVSLEIEDSPIFIKDEESIDYFKYIEDPVDDLPKESKWNFY